MKNHFSRSLYGALIFIGLISVLMFYKLFKIQPADEDTYQELLGTIYGKKEEVNYSTTQKRTLPTKILLLSQDQKRKWGLLKSSSSELFFNRYVADVELAEKLHDVELIFQESLAFSENPMQVVLVMRADEAKYFYKQEKLIAENVKLKRYWIPGVELPSDPHLTNPFFEGTASEFILALGEESPKLEVYRLKAQFQKGP